MKHIICFEEGDIAVTFSKLGKTVIIQNGQVYTVDSAQYRDQLPGPQYSKDVISEKEKRDD